MATRSENRIKTEYIQVRCTPAEKTALKTRADAFGISMGELCRETIFRAMPKAKTDLNSIAELKIARADLGRLGGLFKGWLSGSFERAVAGPKTKAEIVRLIQEIEKSQERVAVAAEALGKPK